MRALLVANWRFWVSVAPAARKEIARWRGQAARIDDEGLRELALGKLAEEAFNAEVAATLATLVPRARRTAAVKAIVVLEVLFDYLDGRTETLLDAVAEDDGEDAMEEGHRLFASLGAVISGRAPTLAGADRDYLDALWREGHAHAVTLPGLAAVAPAALAAASRCGEAQLRLHAAGTRGDGQLESWARQACEGSGLEWREYAGGCASSVLAMHALIASAARADVSEAEAQALDDAYIAIGAVVTMLDSLVDDARDTAAGEAGYIRLYGGGQDIQERLVTLIAEALTRTAGMRDEAHHAMTLAGAAAYYTTHRGAADSQNHGIRAEVRRQLTPTIWPTLAVLRSWRAAKRLRSLLVAGGAEERRTRRVVTGERNQPGA